MSDLNHVVLSGRLTRDPELRHTASGTSVANTGIAVERYNKQDEDNPFVSFINLTIWSSFGELVARKARKGDSVVVTGRLEQRSWEAEDGSKRSAVDLIVDQMKGEFIFRKADGSDTPAATGGQQTLPTGSDTAAAPVAPATDDDIPF